MIKRVVLFFALIASFSLTALPAAAISIPHQATQVAACGTNLASFLGLEPWYGCLQKKYGTSGSTVKLGELNDIWLIVLPLLEDAIKVSGYITVGFVIWGGIKLLKSQGNPSEISQARDVIKNAIIGLLWILLSVVVIEFVALGLQRGIQ